MVLALRAFQIRELIGRAHPLDPPPLPTNSTPPIFNLPLLEIAGDLYIPYWLTSSMFFTSGASKPRETQVLLQDRSSSLYH